MTVGFARQAALVLRNKGLKGVRRAPAGLGIDGDARERGRIPGTDVMREGSPGAGVAKLTGDVRLMNLDADGKANTSRTCRSNRQTDLVNDEPQKAWLPPHEWCRLSFEQKGRRTPRGGPAPCGGP